MNLLTQTLPSGKVLTLSLTTDHKYVMSGGYFGEHSLEVAETGPQRLDAHWKGYCENNLNREVSAQAAAAIEEPTFEPKMSLKGPGGIIVTLDSKQIFPADPGNGTPAMVFVPFKGSATFWCAQVEGEIMGKDYIHFLPENQKRWLNSEKVETTVNEFIHYWTKRTDPNKKG